MAFCTNCGQQIQVDARFCTRCGVSSIDSLGAASIHNQAPRTGDSREPIATPVVGPPKRAGRLAIKGFLLTFLLFTALTPAQAAKGDRSSGQAILALSFGAGVAYIAISLRRWGQRKEAVKGAVIAHIVAGFMALIFVTATTMWIFGAANTDGQQPERYAESPSRAEPVAKIDPKDILLRNVQLTFEWRKGGFGNIMVADFKITNGTPYSFKDFKIECRHSGPSGTRIDSNALTIYEIVSPKSTMSLKNVNMGFIHSQAASSNCQITDLTVL